MILISMLTVDDVDEAYGNCNMILRALLIHSHQCRDPIDQARVQSWHARSKGHSGCRQARHLHHNAVANTQPCESDYDARAGSVQSIGADRSPSEWGIQP